MFDLVADAESYGEYMPGCRSVVVHARRIENDVEFLNAEMRIGYKLIEECIACRVQLDRQNLEIQVENAGGPLRYLTNEWIFHTLDDGGCEIEFDIDFAMKSRTLSFLVNGLFDRVFHYMVEALEARAATVYGVAD